MKQTHDHAKHNLDSTYTQTQTQTHTHTHTHADGPNRLQHRTPACNYPQTHRQTAPRHTHTDGPNQLHHPTLACSYIYIHYLLTYLIIYLHETDT